jgi:hypothetical protein
MHSDRHTESFVPKKVCGAVVEYFFVEDIGERRYVGREAGA